MATPEEHQASITPHKTSGSLMQMSMPPSRNSTPPMDSPRQDQATLPGEEGLDAKAIKDTGAQMQNITSEAVPANREDHFTFTAHQAKYMKGSTTPIHEPSVSNKKSTPTIAKPPLPVNRRLTYTSSPSQAKQLSVPPVAFERSVISPGPLFEPLRSESPTPRSSEDVPASESEVSAAEDNPLAVSKNKDGSVARSSQMASSFTAINASSRSSPAPSSQVQMQNSKPKRFEVRKNTPASLASHASPAAKPPGRRIRPKDLPWDDKETLRLWEAHWDAAGNEINRSEVGLLRANAHREWREANGYGNAHRNWTTLDERMEAVLESGVTIGELRAKVEEGEKMGVFPALPVKEDAREKTFAQKAKQSYRKSRTPAWKEDLGSSRSSKSNRSTPAAEGSITAALLGKGGSKASGALGKTASKRTAAIDDVVEPIATQPLPASSKDAAPTKKGPAKRRAPDADILDQALTPALLSTPPKRAKKAKLAPVHGKQHEERDDNTIPEPTSLPTEREEIEAMAYFNQARLLLRKHCKEVFHIDGRAFDAEVAKWAGEYVEKFQWERPEEYAEWERGREARQERAGKGKEGGKEKGKEVKEVKTQ